MPLGIVARQLENYPDPLMGRGYLSVRATGGAVTSLPYRGTDGVARAIVLARLAESRQRSTIGQGLGLGGCFFASFFAPARLCRLLPKGRKKESKE